MPSETNLFSPKLQRRYRASLRAGHTELPTRWPAGCGGAGNAFLVLLGPSPGGVRKGGRPAKGGGNRPKGWAMGLGAEAMNFDWGDHRKARWTRLCAEMLGGEPYVRAMTALLNLDWRNSTDEKAIPIADLEAGWDEHILPLLSTVRPRIVCALTNRVWNVVAPAAERTRMAFPACPVELAREPIAFRISGCRFPTLLVKPHNHPSRFLSNDQMADLGKACSWFINVSQEPENQRRR
ncbi:MAG: hypothetical protein ABMA15_04385 [Vicinamibacterales bacterium]